MKEEAIKAINDAISSIAMYAIDGFENPDIAKHHASIHEEILRVTCDERVASHFKAIANKVITSRTL